MGVNRIITAALSIIMLSGFSGCDAFGTRNDMGIMVGKLNSYNLALNDLDYIAVRNLTDWSEEDSDYTAIESLFDVDHYGSEMGEDYIACAEYIASTILIVYDINSVTIDNPYATLDVKYVMTDWQKVYSEPHDSCTEVLNTLKDSDDKLTIETTIVFEKHGDDYKLCMLNDLNQVMGFVYGVPAINK